MRPRDDVIIAGGGPAGMMAGLLFARAGCRVRVLEKHRDFLHDFRGDTVHPATMDVLDDLGLLDRFLERPHDRLQKAQLRIGGREMVVGDLSRVKGRTPFVAMMPQWEFLDFLRAEAVQLPNFQVEMGRGVGDIRFEEGRATAVKTSDGTLLGASALIIAADGRRSVVRRRGLLPAKDLGSPIDVFWFELPKRSPEQGVLRIAVDRGRILVRVDRATYWQCAFVIPKGSAQELRRHGVDHVRAEIERVEPRLENIGQDLTSLDQLHLLEVSLDRLTRWSRPGLLAIGDAAHAMSPMGGIGINFAIQDAVAAANLLAPGIAAGSSVDQLLQRVQRRRYASTALVQAVQRIAQNWVLAPCFIAPAVWNGRLGPCSSLTRCPPFAACRAVRSPGAYGGSGCRSPEQFASKIGIGLPPHR
ncbi:FAD-binding protein [Sphingomonas piscis]|uniref:FAD-binding protein n=1 Tax=Sphingomonas piscis TaxID=2714943 RepID=A0A6G7YLE0_9SPHN|nr:FAD-dependent monooxygenase [Sphingomonas piscis]QIK77559.1 FAD-binding protein [Sphingomonas piscis]